MKYQKLPCRELNLGLQHSVPEVWHARVLPDVAVRVPPDVGARPSPHIFVAVLEAAGPRVLVTAVLTHSGLSIARGHLQHSTAQSKLQNSLLVLKCFTNLQMFRGGQRMLCCRGMQ